MPEIKMNGKELIKMKEDILERLNTIGVICLDDDWDEMTIMNVIYSNIHWYYKGLLHKICNIIGHKVMVINNTSTLWHNNQYKVEYSSLYCSRCGSPLSHYITHIDY